MILYILQRFIKNKATKTVKKYAKLSSFKQLRIDDELKFNHFGFDRFDTRLIN